MKSGLILPDRLKKEAAAAPVEMRMTSVELVGILLSRASIYRLDSDELEKDYCANINLDEKNIVSIIIGEECMEMLKKTLGGKNAD